MKQGQRRLATMQTMIYHSRVRITLGIGEQIYVCQSYSAIEITRYQAALEYTQILPEADIIVPNLPAQNGSI